MGIIKIRTLSYGFSVDDLEVGQADLHLHLEAEAGDVEKGITVLDIRYFTFQSHEGTAVNPGLIMDTDVIFKYGLVLQSVEKAADFIDLPLGDAGRSAVMKNEIEYAPRGQDLPTDGVMDVHKNITAEGRYLQHFFPVAPLPLHALKRAVHHDAFMLQGTGDLLLHVRPGIHGIPVGDFALDHR